MASTKRGFAVDFVVLSRLVADTPAQIRRGDVYRLLDAARESGALEAGVAWLHTQRPDLAEEIAGCVAELAEESA